MASFLRQMYFLLYRNFLLHFRDLKIPFLEVFAVIIFMIGLLGISLGTQPDVFDPITYSDFKRYRLLDASGDVSFLPDASRPWAFTPNNTRTQEVMEAVKIAFGDSAPMELLAFPSEDEMVRAYHSRQEPQFAIGIIFSIDSLENSTVVIRMPYEDVPLTNSDSRFTSQASCRTGGPSPGLAKEGCPANQYLFSGFAALQTVLQSAVSSLLTDQSLPLPDFSVQMFPKGSYVEPSLVRRLVSSIFLIYMYAVFFIVLLTTLVRERKLKEVMLMMGTSNIAYWLAWFLTYLIIMLLVSLVTALLTKYAIQLFPKGNFLIIFLIMFVYGMSLVCLSFMLSALFTSPLVAGTFGVILATIIPSLVFILINLVDGLALRVRWGLSFFVPIGLGHAIGQAITLDQLGPGIQFDNLGPEGFPPYLAMLAIDAAVYLIIAVYFDNVRTAGNPCFCFVPSYWCGRSRKSADDVESSEVSQKDVELVSPEMEEKAGIRICNLSKTFQLGYKIPPVCAVQGMTLDIYEGQITCLLGHSGAGKTTLINTLTGLIRADSGEATIYGYDARDHIQMQKIRSMMGVCPQENTLFDHLTPREHLKVYAGLKGVPFGDISAQVEKLLEKTQLAQSAGTKSKDLSGGQKRKLCVGIALIGDPKVVFLDEPSSGMDPYSRRQMWNLLKSQRQGRITVLTTHFMDEADILADRKAVMSQGSLRCCGSSLFLKNRFGIGYHLDMVVEQDVDIEHITELVTTHVPEGKVSRRHGMELVYVLPLQDANKFPGLFRALEATNGSKDNTVAKKLGIQSYGVSMAMLEEVFLKLGDKEKEDKPEEDEEDVTDTTPFNQSVNTDYNTLTRENDETVSMTADHLLTKPLKPGKYQLRALLQLQRWQKTHNPMTYFLGLVLPVIYVVVAVVLATAIDLGTPPGQDPATMTLEPGLYLESSSQSSLPKLTPLLYQDNLTDGEDISLLVDQFDRMGLISNATANMTELMAVAPHNMATVANHLGTNSGNPDFLVLYNDTAQHSLPVLLSILSNAIVPLETPDQTFLNLTVASHPLPALTFRYIYNPGFFLAVFLNVAITFFPWTFMVEVVKERQEKVRGYLRVSGVTAANYWASRLVVDAVHMYIFTVAAIVFIIAVGFPIGGLALSTPGGMVTFIIFMIIYVPPTLLFCYCVSFAFQDFEVGYACMQMLYFQGPLILGAVVAFLDFFAPESSTAPEILHIIFCVCFPPYANFGTVYYINKIYHIAVALQRLDELSFADYFAMDKLILPSMLCVLVSVVWVLFLLRVLEIRSAGGSWKDAFFCSSGKVRTILPNPDHIEDEDSDVMAERDRVEAIFDHGSRPEKCVLAAVGVRKDYHEKNSGCGGQRKPETGGFSTVVRNLTLSVNEGEVLGLVGLYGAGKTTSMDVMTGATQATSGQIQIAGHDITSSPSNAFRAMGYCPQHDPLFENVTVREHLEAYGLIKGVHPDDVKAVTDHYMEALEMTEHANKKTQLLSRGTKRKLCFAISMLGKPKLVFMDEPSTCLDPTTKRLVWRAIADDRSRSDWGAILMMHSMEEAETVCSRVGIMVSGKLVCLGTTQHLKDKYGGSYVLKVKLNPGEAYYSMDRASGQANQLLDQLLSALDSRIKVVFPSAELTESFREHVTYKIPSQAVVSLATAFAALEQGKETLHIEEYSFSQATLEQVFLEFARVKRAEDEKDTQLSHQGERFRVTDTV